MLHKVEIVFKIERIINSYQIKKEFEEHTKKGTYKKATIVMFKDIKMSAARCTPET